MKKIILSAAALFIAQVGVAQVTFSDVTIGTNHTDRCIADMNGDSLDDIISVSSNNIQVFYQQDNGSFIERNYPTSFANNSPSWSLAAGDYNRDGYLDLLYGGGSGVTFMKSVASSNGIDGLSFEEDSFPEFVFSQRSNFVDINNDGHLDAFVCHDVEPNVYYINDGNGNFSYNQGGLGDFPSGGDYGSVWVDYDNDRDIDMFIAKCNGGGAAQGGQLNQMYQNNGNGNYTEVAESLDLRDPIQTWSSAWGDYDNDGDMDAFVGASNFGEGFHRLMRNNGNGTFTDVIASSGLTNFMNTSIENQTYDFNNDGALDIVSGGRILYGNGDLTFTETTNNVNATIFGDLNNDGFIDGFSNGTIRYNNGNANNWIKFQTIGTTSNINGIGARVEIVTASGTKIRDVRSGEGFGDMDTLNTHFGLGTDDVVESVTIYWPSGTIDVFENLTANATYVLEEGTTLGTDEFLVDNLILYPNPAIDHINISALDELETPLFTIFDMTGRRVMHGKLETNQINISELQSGNYMVRVFDREYKKKTTKTQKFTKR